MTASSSRIGTSCKSIVVKWSRDWIWPLSTKRLQRGANGLIASRYSSPKLSSYARDFSTKDMLRGHAPDLDSHSLTPVTPF